MPVLTTNELLANSHLRLEHFHKFHSKHIDVSLSEYIRQKRQFILVGHESKKIIYYDTNAWKCISDYVIGKPTLTPDMIAFAELATDKNVVDKCIFPIGLSTIFELQTMTDPLTIESLSKLIDDYSKNICIAFETERIETEFALFRQNAKIAINPKELFFRRPFELFGIPMVELPNEWKSHFEITAFNKALYDVLLELPASAQLSLAFEQKDEKWDNEKGIAELNKGKLENKNDIANFTTTVFIELAGSLSTLVSDEPRILGMIQPKYFAAQAILHWKANPKSYHLSTARVLANLYGLMRYDKHRVYKKGDISDFFTAASALPIADAFFTDRRLSYIATDAQTEISKFCHCDIIFGFNNFASYLQIIRNAT